MSVCVEDAAAVSLVLKPQLRPDGGAAVCGDLEEAPASVWCRQAVFIGCGCFPVLRYFGARTRPPLRSNKTIGQCGSVASASAGKTLRYS